MHPRSCLALAVALAGCHLVGGTDGLYIIEETNDPGLGGAGAATSTSTTATSATTSGGGNDTTFDCTLADQCPLPEDPCLRPKCTLGTCEFVPTETSMQVRCGENLAGYCNGSGSCVQCLDNAHCAGAVCLDDLCVDSSCEDEVMAGDETDVDCGGSCPPCDTGEMCTAPAHCKSGICSGGLCAICTDHQQCAGDHYCALGGSGWCVPKKGIGGSCSANYECTTGNCADYYFICWY